MNSGAYNQEKVLNGISKQEILNEIEQLNQKFKLIEQKLSIRIDTLILEEYQQLENDITFSFHSMKRLHSQRKEKRAAFKVDYHHHVMPNEYINYLISD